jgi:hypothetical protein
MGVLQKVNFGGKGREGAALTGARPSGLRGPSYNKRRISGGGLAGALGGFHLRAAQLLRRRVGHLLEQSHHSLNVYLTLSDTLGGGWVWQLVRAALLMGHANGQGQAIAPRVDVQVSHAMRALPEGQRRGGLDTAELLLRRWNGCC